MNRFFSILINIGLAGFLLFTGLLLVAYIGLLFEKLVHPNFKNMNNKEALYLGLSAILFLILDFFIVRRFIMLRKKSE